MMVCILMYDVTVRTFRPAGTARVWAQRTRYVVQLRARHLKVSVMHEILRCGNVWRMMTKLGTVRTYCLSVCV